MMGYRMAWSSGGGGSVVVAWWIVRGVVDVGYLGIG